MIYIILLILFVVLLFWVLKRMKTPKVPAMAVVTGAVKAGKSTFSTYLVFNELWKRRVKVNIFNFFCCLFGKKDKRKPKPLLYSNVPLACDYVPVTEALLKRKERFVYGSVIYLQESSLVADSMDYKDSELNEELLLFSKLIGHETKGGCLILDTQSMSDNQYNIKRSVTSSFFVHHAFKGFPFFICAWIREERYNADGTVLTVYNEDVEQSLQFVLIPKRVWKKFDCYCYSVLTDSLPVAKNIIKGKELPDLKARQIVSFRKFKNGGKK